MDTETFAKYCFNTLSDMTCAKITANSTVVTATKRLAARLRDTYRSEKNANAWVSADILPLQQWLLRCWQNTFDSRLVLSPMQQQLLWEQIIGESVHNPLLPLPAMAKSAMQAWQLIQEWQVSWEILEQHCNTKDCETFLQWAKQFAALCEKNHYLDAASIANLLPDYIQNQPLPEKLILAGFDQLTPQMQKLLQQLKTVIQIEILESKQFPSSIHRVMLANQEQELMTMARWAKKHWMENPQKKIACIIPNLNAVREKVEWLFHKASSPMPFNISIGLPLISYPLIKTAFLILKLIQQKKLDIEELSTLLRSPFLGDAEKEISSRALLDQKLRYLGETQISLQTFIAYATEEKLLLAPRLQALRNQYKKLSSSQLPSAWAAFFDQQLKIMEWPGERGINSLEYQVIQRWFVLLSEFAGLDFILKEIDFATAIEYCQQLASNTVFQPQTTHAPVQIVGAFESGGLEFDALWVSGLNDEKWPPALNPHPLLPGSLQQQLSMPHANIEHETRFHEALIKRFCHSASDVIFSYSQQKEDQTLSPSPLIQAFPILTFEQLNLDPTSFEQQLLNSRLLEPYADDVGPAISNNETIKGGADIFKSQAACPFQAFAKYRLGAKALDKPHLGLDQKERGTLLHSVLFHLWNQIKRHHTLLQLSEIELTKTIEKSIATALTEFAKKKYLLLKPVFKELETQRLKKLILQWMQYEKKRQAFTVIAQEELRCISFQGLELKLRIDRIDQLKDGSHVLIDYKTSKRIQKDVWFGEKPDDLQLPLYGITHTSKVSGLAFAKVTPLNMEFNGITNNSTQLFEQGYSSQIKMLSECTSLTEAHNWDVLFNDWKIALQVLATEFSQGYAKVSPKEVTKTCDYCDLKPFCRIAEKCHD